MNIYLWYHSHAVGLWPIYTYSRATPTIQTHRCVYTSQMELDMRLTITIGSWWSSWIYIYIPLLSSVSFTQYNTLGPYTHVAVPHRQHKHSDVSILPTGILAETQSLGMRLTERQPHIEKERERPPLTAIWRKANQYHKELSWSIAEPR